MNSLKTISYLFISTICRALRKYNRYSVKFVDGREGMDTLMHGERLFLLPKYSSKNLYFFFLEGEVKAGNVSNTTRRH